MWRISCVGKQCTALPKRQKMPDPNTDLSAEEDVTKPSQPEARPPAASSPKAAPPPQAEGYFARLEQKVKHTLGPKPIRGKVMSVSMLACVAAMLLGGFVFLVFDLNSAFLTARSRLKSLAHTTAENTRDALAEGAAQELVFALNGVMDHPHVTGAAIYIADGRAVARPTKRADLSLPATIPADASAGTKFGLSGMKYFEPIVQDGRRLGTVVIEISSSQLWSEFRLHALVGIGILILAAAVAKSILGRLQGMISEPVAELAKLAESVAKDGNFSLRAEKRHEDEVGYLADTFNVMLMGIQERDTALNQAKADLEANVKARTTQLETEIAERKRAEEAMKDSEHHYRNLFENNPMPMWVMDLETMDFIAVNNAAVRHYGYSHSEFRQLSLPAITKCGDPLEVERAFRTSQKSFDAGEWKHKRRGGEVIEVHLTAHAIVFAGKVAKIVLANDVTERNRAQRQVAEMHQKLMDASRAAGMAEVATGVLHNVGNVLNSVNVSANVLADSVRRSKAASIRKVADLLEANKADLPAFFSQGGKGQMVPGYLATLAQQIDTEQEGRLAEIDQLSKNIAHIKDIVAMQQDHAKVAGVMEDFAPAVLIEEALRMTGADLESASVKIEVACSPGLPHVTTDRHKVLQILVNLITNAQQAMEETALEKRLLNITATPDGNGHAAIAIRDSGCGIGEEDLTRVFNHGFTTKPTGHGFGLHSAANAATEIGGSLTGASDGRGKGATFTLTLPLTAAAEIQKAA
jgi:PAS domain S-box-containing protein